MERSGLTTLGLRGHVWNEEDVVSLACEGKYGAKWTKYHWLSNARMERSGLSTLGLSRWLCCEVSIT